MFARARFRVLGFSGVCLWLCLSGSAGAQAPDPAARAIAKGREALALFERGSYDEALAKFQQAEALYHSPVFLLYAGRSFRERGRWREALTTLRRVAAEDLHSAAPRPGSKPRLTRDGRSWRSKVSCRASS